MLKKEGGTYSGSTLLMLVGRIHSTHLSSTVYTSDIPAKSEAQSAIAGAAISCLALTHVA